MQERERERFSSPKCDYFSVFRGVELRPGGCTVRPLPGGNYAVECAQRTTIGIVALNVIGICVEEGTLRSDKVYQIERQRRECLK